MTHDELLAKVTTVYDFIAQDNREFDDLDKCVFALRAVVELHKPNNEYTDDAIVCNECYRDFYFGGQYFQYGKYPCKTIQAIEKELK